jgi:hypothetical protein
MMDMKGKVYFTPANNLTEELIRRVEIAIQVFSESSLYFFGKNRRSDVGKMIQHCFSKMFYGNLGLISSTNFCRDFMPKNALGLRFYFTNNTRPNFTMQ